MEKNRLKFFSKNLDSEYLLDFKFPKLRKGKSSIHGDGIYAVEKIKKGSVVCPLYGFLYSLGKAKVNYPKYSYQISDDIAIETSNEPGFFNHSCNPNVFINNIWIFEAKRDIVPGEEIVVDYGTVDYFEYDFSCVCKAKECRKIVDGRIAANKQYQSKMSKFFSPYLKLKIKNL